MLELARELIKLKNEKKMADKRSKEIAEDIKKIEAELSEKFIDNGLSNIGVDGNNVILVEKNSIKCDQSEELVEILTENGYTHVFNKPINPTSFSSLVKNDESARSLVMDHIEVNSFYQFQVRKK